MSACLEGGDLLGLMHQLGFRWWKGLPGPGTRARESLQHFPSQ